MTFMKQNDSQNGKHTITVVNEALELVAVLARQEDDETTTKGLAIRLGIPRTTCYRILRSLTAKDWVRPVEGGRHVLSLGLLPLLEPLREVEHLAYAVQPCLNALAQQCELVAKFSVRQGDYSVTLARCESPRQTSVTVRLGASFHITNSSSGTALMAGLADEEVREIIERAPETCWEHQQPADVFKRLNEVKQRGWYADIGGLRANYHAISVRVRDARGGVPGAITIIGFPADLRREEVASDAAMLLKAAKEAAQVIAKLKLTPPPASGSRAKARR